MAGSTGLEPAASGLTVQCANQAAPRAHTTWESSQTIPRRGSGLRRRLLAQHPHAHLGGEGVVVAAEVAIDLCQLRQRLAQDRMVGVERLLLDLDRALQQRDRGDVAALRNV